MIFFWEMVGIGESWRGEVETVIFRLRRYFDVSKSVRIPFQVYSTIYSLESEYFLGSMFNSSYSMYVLYVVYVCMVITYSRVWINRVRLPILLVVS